MKKTLKVTVCLLSAMSMLTGNVLSVAAGSLNDEELFEKYAAEFPVYGSVDIPDYGIKAISLDYENTKYYDLDGNEIDCCFENCRIYDNPYRYREMHEEDELVNPDDFIYTCSCENGIYYAILENGNAIIAGADQAWVNENSPESLVLPSEIDSAKVTEIADNAFNNLGFKCESLREIVIPDTVEIIRPYAFAGAFSFRSGCNINIPENVKVICRRAFADLYDAVGEEYDGEEKADRVITLPESLEYIQNDAFGDSSRYIFKMPESLVLTDTTVIGGSETIEFNKLAQNIRNYYNKYYIDGAFNVVTFTDAIKYQQEKQSDDYQIADEVLWEERANEIGDVNVSGTTDVSDSVLLARFCSEDPDAVLTVEGKANADANGDAALNMDDVIEILQIVAKLK